MAETVKHINAAKKEIVKSKAASSSGEDPWTNARFRTAVVERSKARAAALTKITELWKPHGKQQTGG